MSIREEGEMHRVNDAKFGPLDVPSQGDGEWADLLVMFVVAALFAVGAAIGFGTWHDHIAGPEFRTSAETTRYINTSFACAAGTSTQAAEDQCMKDSGLAEPSYPWPTTHVWLSAAMVFVAVLAIGRLYIFMRRIESQSR